jgi:hypothetical protein
MKRLFLFFSLLAVSFAASANPEPVIRNLESISLFHFKKGENSKLFYSIGTEWFNFYCYGQTDEGFWNFSTDFLPSSINMEFRKNLLEKDNDHSVSVAFAPQFGAAIMATEDVMGQHAALPLYLQYNIGLGATHRSKKEEGRSFAMGPSINFFNSFIYEYKPSSMISIDIQYSKRIKLENGRIKFNYFRVGIDPSDEEIPKRGFHVDFGVGREFGL